MNIILSLGANYNSEENIIMAEERLAGLFPAIRFSRMLRNPAVGMPDGTPDYVNVVGVGDTSLLYDDVKAKLRTIEQQLGRMPEGKKNGIIPIDIDVLQLGTIRYKPDDWQRPYNILLLHEMS